MKWKQPPIIKIYEALGAVADGRIETINDREAKVYSSSRKKFYTVEFDPGSNSIMTNDNGSYWQGYLGYPAIAYLLKIGVLEYEEELANLLKGIAWKDVNQKFKNDFDKTLEFVLNSLSTSEKTNLATYIKEIQKTLAGLQLDQLGKRKLPPKGY